MPNPGIKGYFASIGASEKDLAFLSLSKLIRQLPTVETVGNSIMEAQNIHSNSMTNGFNRWRLQQSASD